jgi:ankyrin repeat protein
VSAKKRFHQLLQAFHLNDLDTVEAMLEAGVDPDAGRVDGGGDTLLMLAVRKERRDVVRLLLAHGASALIENRAGETARSLGEAARDRAIAALFETAEPIAAASVRLFQAIERIGDGLPPQAVLEHVPGADLSLRQDGRTPLLALAARGARGPEVYAALLAAGEDAATADDGGDTALHHLARHDLLEEARAVIDAAPPRCTSPPRAGRIGSWRCSSSTTPAPTCATRSARPRSSSRAAASRSCSWTGPASRSAATSSSRCARAGTSATSRSTATSSSSRAIRAASSSCSTSRPTRSRRSGASADSRSSTAGSARTSRGARTRSCATASSPASTTAAARPPAGRYVRSFATSGDVGRVLASLRRLASQPRPHLAELAITVPAGTRLRVRGDLADPLIAATPSLRSLYFPDGVLFPSFPHPAVRRCVAASEIEGLAVTPHQLVEPRDLPLLLEALDTGTDARELFPDLGARLAELERAAIIDDERQLTALGRVILDERLAQTAAGTWAPSRR